MGYSQPRRIEEFVIREVGLALLLLLVALIQSALLPRINSLELNPLLLLIICQSLLAGPANATRWAFYGGLSLDICADTALGTHAIALLLAALLPALLFRGLSRRNWLLPILGVGVGALVYYSAMGLLTALLVAWVDPHTYATVVMLPSTLLALIPALPLFLLMRWRDMRRRGEVPVDVY